MLSGRFKFGFRDIHLGPLCRNLAVASFAQRLNVLPSRSGTGRPALNQPCLNALHNAFNNNILFRNI